MIVLISFAQVTVGLRSIGISEENDHKPLKLNT